MREMGCCRASQSGVHGLLSGPCQGVRRSINNLFFIHFNPKWKKKYDRTVFALLICNSVQTLKLVIVYCCYKSLLSHEGLWGDLHLLYMGGFLMPDYGNVWQSKLHLKSS